MNKNKTVIPMISVLHLHWQVNAIYQTTRSMLCWLQHIGQILIYSESNIRHLIKDWK